MAACATFWWSLASVWQRPECRTIAWKIPWFTVDIKLQTSGLNIKYCIYQCGSSSLRVCVWNMASRKLRNTTTRWRTQRTVQIAAMPSWQSLKFGWQCWLSIGNQEEICVSLSGQLAVLYYCDVESKPSIGERKWMREQVCLLQCARSALNKSPFWYAWCAPGNGARKRASNRVLFTINPGLYWELKYIIYYQSDFEGKVSKLRSLRIYASKT